MEGHTIVVTALPDDGRAYLEADCTCGASVVADEWSITLDRLAELAHQHIESSDAAPPRLTQPEPASP